MNLCCIIVYVAGEKLKHDTIDALEDLLKLFVNSCNEIPWLLKSDIDGAYRRIPLSSKERKWCAIAFKHSGKVNTLVYSVCSACGFAQGVGCVALRMPVWIGAISSCMGTYRPRYSPYCESIFTSSNHGIR